MTELKLGWKDLEEADTRGRWWIVGSAFTGTLAGQLFTFTFYLALYRQVCNFVNIVNNMPALGSPECSPPRIELGTFARRSAF